MENHKHYRKMKGRQICMDCGAQLCNHYLANLTGCTLDLGHDEPHLNINDERLGLQPQTWLDNEGMFVSSEEDWVKLISYIGDKSSPFPASNGKWIIPSDSVEVVEE